MMSVASLSNHFTAEDLLRLPDNSGMELVDGRIVEKNVSFLSSKIELRIAHLFSSYTDRTSVAEILPATMGYRCFQNLLDDPDRMRKPDVSVIKIDRIKALPNPNPGYMPIPPDLAVEVLSTNDTVNDVNEKLFEYRGAGFPLVWVVDPVARTVTVYPNPGKPFIRSEDDELTAESALPGFSCRVSDLFPPL
jgi:Uma2 family endonuclease